MADQPVENIAFRTLISDHSSAFEEAGLHLARDRQAWDRLWPLVTGNRRPAVDPPPLDWTTEMAVVVALGTRATAGYDVEIVRLTRRAGVLWIHAVETRPAPGLLTGQMLTRPVHAIVTTRHEGDARLAISTPTGYPHPCG